MRVHGLTGPHLSAGTVRVVSRRTAAGDVLVTLRAVADCRSLASLNVPGGRYLLVARLTDGGRSVARARLRASSAQTDWGAAVRQDCWQRVAAGGIEVAGVVAEPVPTARSVQLAVRLTSTLATDVQVGAVDVADVSTLEGADTGTLPAGGTLVLRVRRPVGDCPPSSPGGGPHGPLAVDVLQWSVGPVGVDAAATFLTAVPSAVAETVQDAVRRFCGRDIAIGVTPARR
jgi:hypothetical protein